PRRPRRPKIPCSENGVLARFFRAGPQFCLPSGGPRSLRSLDTPYMRIFPSTPMRMVPAARARGRTPTLFARQDSNGPRFGDVDQVAGVLVADHLDSDLLRVLAEVGLVRLADHQAQPVGPLRLLHLSFLGRTAGQELHRE